MVGFLIGFGLLGALSNGLPLLLLGIALAIVCAFGGWRVARRIAADMSMNPTVA